MRRGVLLTYNSTIIIISYEDIINFYPLFGFLLSGSHEINPGSKDLPFTDKIYLILLSNYCKSRRTWSLYCIYLNIKNYRFQEDACTLQEVDLVANCPLLRVTPSRTPSPAPSYLSSSYKSMGQRPSTLLRPKISLTWVLRGQQHQHNDVNNTASIQESQIIRKSKDRSSRRSVKSIKSIKTKESTEIIDRDKHERCNVLQEIDKIVRHEKVLNILIRLNFK